MMKKLNILVTGGGSPGIAGTIYSLKNNFDSREIRIVSTDVKQDCPGKYLSEAFFQIPHANQNEEYLESLLHICIKEKIDVILPQNTGELAILADHKDTFAGIGTQVAVSDAHQLRIANNKFELLKRFQSLHIPHPRYFLVKNRNELMNAAKNLGWPQKPFVVKPPDSNGSRGVRIVDENLDYKKLFYTEKPTSLFIRLEMLIEIIGEVFETLLAMEYLPGEEVSIDAFRMKNHFIAIPRIREEIRSGISFRNRTDQREELLSYSKMVADSLDLQYCFGLQYKYDDQVIPKILECNPRVQGTMVFATFMGANIIYASVKSCLGEPIPQFSMNWDTRLIRYWGAIGIRGDEIEKV